MKMKYSIWGLIVFSGALSAMLSHIVSREKLNEFTTKYQSKTGLWASYNAWMRIFDGNLPIGSSVGSVSGQNRQRHLSLFYQHLQKQFIDQQIKQSIKRAKL